MEQFVPNQPDRELVLRIARTDRHRSAEDIPVDLDTVTVVNDWQVVHIGRRDQAERALALATTERNR